MISWKHTCFQISSHVKKFEFPSMTRKKIEPHIFKNVKRSNGQLLKAYNVDPITKVLSWFADYLSSRLVIRNTTMKPWAYWGIELGIKRICGRTGHEFSASNNILPNILLVNQNWFYAILICSQRRAVHCRQEKRWAKESLWTMKSANGVVYWKETATCWEDKSLF